MYCIKCGTKNLQDAKYCYECGALLNNDKLSNNSYEVINDKVIKIYNNDRIKRKNIDDDSIKNHNETKISQDLNKNASEENNSIDNKKINNKDMNKSLKNNVWYKLPVIRIIICLSIILSLAYAVSYRLLVRSKLSDVKKVNAENNKIDTTPGNLSGNLLNEGIIAEKNNWIYYNNSDGLYKMKSDGSAVANISSDNANYINIIGDYIYYINISNGNSIYKIKTDGTSKNKILSSSSKSINIIGNWIYYCKSTENGLNFRLYKINLDGTNDTKISNDSIVGGDFTIVNNLIYYKINSDNGGETLYSVKLDGSDKRKICDNVKEFNVVGNYIYYYNPTNNAGLYKMKTDGNNKIKLSDDVVDAFNVGNNKIYYTVDQHINEILYSIDLNGENKIKLAELSGFTSINISKNFLFYIDRSVDDYAIKNISIDNSLKSNNDTSKINKIDEKENNRDFILPNSDTVKLKQSDIDNLTKQQLVLARNELFARHGYIFTTPEIKSYFQSKPWYHPDASYNGELTNDIEKANLQLIEKAEETK